MPGMGVHDRRNAHIPDVDVLLFVPEDQGKRTPNAILRELNGVLKGYTGSGQVDVSGQRRSVRLELPEDEICLDIVPSIAKNGLDEALLVPDRPQETWIPSDPLGYARRLTKINQENGEKLVPLIKLIKAWRNEQMVYRRPKSYVLEVILLYALAEGELVLCDRPWAQNVHDGFAYIADRYSDLMDNGSEAPRIRDPQITDRFITRGWTPEHFETFMRRVREARRAAERALAAGDEATASAEWKKVFGSRWPGDEDVKETARAEARLNQPGQARISSTGRVIGGPALIATRATTFHGA